MDFFAKTLPVNRLTKKYFLFLFLTALTSCKTSSKNTSELASPGEPWYEEYQVKCPAGLTSMVFEKFPPVGKKDGKLMFQLSGQQYTRVEFDTAGNKNLTANLETWLTSREKVGFRACGRVKEFRFGKERRDWVGMVIKVNSDSLQDDNTLVSAPQEIHPECAKYAYGDKNANTLIETHAGFPVVREKLMKPNLSGNYGFSVATYTATNFPTWIEILFDRSKEEIVKKSLYPELRPERLHYKEKGIIFRGEDEEANADNIKNICVNVKQVIHPKANDRLYIFADLHPNTMGKDSTE